MSNIDQMTYTCDLSSVDDEQLFTELTPEEGANLSGGAVFCVCNSLNTSSIAFAINGKANSLGPGETKKFSLPDNQAIVTWDKKLGPGFVPIAKKITPGVLWCFDFDSGGLNLNSSGLFCILNSTPQVS